MQKSDNEVRKVSSAHLRAFRKNDMHCSQAQLAEKMDVSELTLGRWERGETSMPRRAIDKLAALSGYIPEYWQGLTEYKNRFEYEESVLDAACHEYSTECELVRQKYEKVKALFSFCGYGYEYLRDKAEYDFLSVLPKRSPKQEMILKEADAGRIHMVTKYGEPEDSSSTFFSDEEIEKLLSAIQDTIDFTCYKQRRNSKTHE